MNNAIKAISILTLVSSLTIAASTGIAQDAARQPSRQGMSVEVSDIDINTTAGATILYSRIKRVARRICGREHLSSATTLLYRDCVKTAIDDTVAAVNLPQLTSVHRGAAAQLASR